MKKIIKSIILLPAKLLLFINFGYEKLICIILPRFIGLNHQLLIDKLDSSLMSIKHNNKRLFRIYTPNSLCRFRGDTFSSKEPETLEWIDRYGGPNCVFFDIGANIGLYSLYYATTKLGKVYSFEPSAFNLKQLAKNISINNQQEIITIVPNPLSNITGESIFINGDQAEGGSLSAFGVDFGFDGLKIQSDIKYGLLGFSLDDLMKANIFSDEPTLIKIDVDGIEHIILKGAINTLRSTKLRSILIEVNDDFKSQSKEVEIELINAGFKLQEKAQSDYLHNSTYFGRTFNQIWIK